MKIENQSLSAHLIHPQRCQSSSSSSSSSSAEEIELSLARDIVWKSGSRFAVAGSERYHRKKKTNNTRAVAKKNKDEQTVSVLMCLDENIQRFSRRQHRQGKSRPRKGEMSSSLLINEVPTKTSTFAVGRHTKLSREMLPSTLLASLSLDETLGHIASKRTTKHQAGRSNDDEIHSLLVAASHYEDTQPRRLCQEKGYALRMAYTAAGKTYSGSRRMHSIATRSMRGDRGHRTTHGILSESTLVLATTNDSVHTKRMKAESRPKRRPQRCVAFAPKTSNISDGLLAMFQNEDNITKVTTTVTSASCKVNDQCKAAEAGDNMSLGKQPFELDDEISLIRTLELCQLEQSPNIDGIRKRTELLSPEITMERKRRDQKKTPGKSTPKEQADSSDSVSTEDQNPSQLSKKVDNMEATKVNARCHMDVDLESSISDLSDDAALPSLSAATSLPITSIKSPINHERRQASDSEKLSQNRKFIAKSITHLPPSEQHQDTSDVKSQELILKPSTLSINDDKDNIVYSSDVKPQPLISNGSEVTVQGNSVHEDDHGETSENKPTISHQSGLSPKPFVDTTEKVTMDNPPILRPRRKRVVTDRLTITTHSASGYTNIVSNKTSMKAKRSIVRNLKSNSASQNETNVKTRKSNQHEDGNAAIHQCIGYVEGSTFHKSPIVTLANKSPQSSNHLHTTRILSFERLAVDDHASVSNDCIKGKVENTNEVIQCCEVTRRSRRDRKPTDFFHNNTDFDNQKLLELDSESSLIEESVLRDGEGLNDNMKDTSCGEHSSDIDINNYSADDSLMEKKQYVGDGSQPNMTLGRTIPPRRRRIRVTERKPICLAMMRNVESQHDSINDDWRPDQVDQLIEGINKVDPMSDNFWYDVATAVDDKTEAECRVKWFSTANTPMVKVHKSKAPNKKAIYHETVDEDDIFNSSPMREFHFPDKSNNSLKCDEVNRFLGNHDIGSAIKFDVTKCLMGKDSPELRPKAGYKVYLQNLKRDVNKAQKAKPSRKGAKITDKGPRMLSETAYDSDVDVNVQLSPGGTLKIKSYCDNDEDDFWEAEYDGEDEGEIW